MSQEQKTEERYQEFARIGRILGVPVFEAFLTLEVLDQHGNRLSYHKQRSHSWTRNAYNHLFGQLASKNLDDATPFGGGYLNIKITDGNIRSGVAPSSISNVGSGTLNTADNAELVMGGYRGPVGNDDYGILVGTGTDAESFEDYVLQTKIAHGTAAGELSHVEGDPHVITYSTLTLENELKRYFNNNSGGSIGVNEIALVTRGYSASGDNQHFLTARDKLGATVDVPDTGQLKVTYTIQLIYPA